MILVCRIFVYGFRKVLYACDPCIVMNACSFPALVSHGDIDAQRVSSNTLCLGMAQSYLERKLHMTITPFTFSLFATALKTRLAIPLFPEPGYAVHMYL